MSFEEKKSKDKGKKKGLKKQKKKIQTDQDRKKVQKVIKIEKDMKAGKLIVENDGDGVPILKQTFKDLSKDEKGDGILNMEK